MQIDNETLINAACIFIAIEMAGSLGAYSCRHILESSPAGVILACGVTTSLAIGVLFSTSSIRLKFVGLMAAYPIGLLIPNLIGYKVYHIEPAMTVLIGGMLLAPLAFISVILATCTD